MVSAASIGAAHGGGYARYLEGKTVEPERGDYYLTPTGEPAQAPGRWLASQETLQLLGIDTGPQVRGRDFTALMEGRHPETGRWLRPEGAGGGRGGGIDLTFSAPKSVSTAWALSDPSQRELLENAHANAVKQSVGHLRDTVPALRHRHRGLVVEEIARDLVAAEYRHTTARGVSRAQAPDPQLHSHVVISGAVRGDGRLVAVASRPIFRAKRELGAYYRCALAQELKQQGYVIRQATGAHERYFEIDGVPSGLCETFSSRSREVARAAERFRAAYGRAPLPGELRHLKLESRRAKELATRGDLDHAWQQTAAAHQFDPYEAARLWNRDPLPAPEPALEDRIEAHVTERRAVFRPTELRATALEQAAGELAPKQALARARAMIAERRIVPLEGDWLTTLAQRAREQAIQRRVIALAAQRGPAIGRQVCQRAANEVAERIGAPLSDRQQHAVQVLTGPERVAVMIGPAGTGKGVVIDAVARAEQHSGCDVLGVAVAGSTAERLGRDSPSLKRRTMTVDSLLARAERATLTVDRHTTIFLDEAGMIDTMRLDRLTRLVENSQAKLVAIGDGRQLPAIGPGGMFDQLTKHAPTIELEEIYRTTDPDERRAWTWLRAGEPEKAMAHYRSKGQLHMIDTRDQAGEAAVQAWAQATETYEPRDVALLTDASNHELDRLNARAQHIRGQRHELGDQEIALQSVPYGLRQGDRVAFINQHYLPGQPRVENGTLGHITHITPEHGLTIALDGTSRQVALAGGDLEKLRLGYAQHVVREQGATVEHSIVITGGWQTSRETAYVEATRARHGTQWFIARDELGDAGQDADRITRLADHMRSSRAQLPTLQYRDALEVDSGPHLERAAVWRPRLPGLAGPDRSHGHDRRQTLSRGR